MKQPNITPGPWKEARKSHFCIVGNGGTFVADMRPSASTAGISTPRQEANARAIAALPALLEALEKTFASLEDAREIILDLDPDAHARTRPLSDQIANARAALRVAGYEF